MALRIGESVRVAPRSVLLGALKCANYLQSEEEGVALEAILDLFADNPATVTQDVADAGDGTLCLVKLGCGTEARLPVSALSTTAPNGTSPLGTPKELRIQREHFTVLGLAASTVQGAWRDRQACRADMQAFRHAREAQRKGVIQAEADLVHGLASTIIQATWRGYAARAMVRARRHVLGTQAPPPPVEEQTFGPENNDTDYRTEPQLEPPLDPGHQHEPAPPQRLHAPIHVPREPEMDQGQHEHQPVPLAEASGHRDRATFLRSCADGNLEAVHRLFRDAGVDTEVVDEDGNTGLMLSSAAGRLDVVQYLRHVGAKLDVRNHSGWSSLHRACFNGHVLVVEALLSALPVLISLPNNSGSMPLHVAMPNGQLDVVRALVGTYGADIEAKNASGDTPLHFAVVCRQPEIVRYLLDKGANPAPVNDDAHTPLHTAEQTFQLDVAQMLAEACGEHVQAHGGRPRTQQGASSSSLTGRSHAPSALADAAMGANSSGSVLPDPSLPGYNGPRERRRNILQAWRDATKSRVCQFVELKGKELLTILEVLGAVSPAQVESVRRASLAQRFQVRLGMPENTAEDLELGRQTLIPGALAFQGDGGSGNKTSASAGGGKVQASPHGKIARKRLLGLITGPDKAVGFVADNPKVHLWSRVKGGGLLHAMEVPTKNLDPMLAGRDLLDLTLTNMSQHDVLGSLPSILKQRLGFFGVFLRAVEGFERPTAAPRPPSASRATQPRATAPTSTKDRTSTKVHSAPRGGASAPAASKAKPRPQSASSKLRSSARNKDRSASSSGSTSSRTATTAPSGGGNRARRRHTPAPSSDSKLSSGKGAPSPKPGKVRAHKGRSTRSSSSMGARTEGRAGPVSSVVAAATATTTGTGATAGAAHHDAVSMSSTTRVSAEDGGWLAASDVFDGLRVQVAHFAPHSAGQRGTVLSDALDAHQQALVHLDDQRVVRIPPSQLYALPSMILHPAQIRAGLSARVVTPAWFVELLSSRVPVAEAQSLAEEIGGAVITITDASELPSRGTVEVATEAGFTASVPADALVPLTSRLSEQQPTPAGLPPSQQQGTATASGLQNSASATSLLTTSVRSLFREEVPEHVHEQRQLQQHQHLQKPSGASGGARSHGRSLYRDVDVMPPPPTTTSTEASPHPAWDSDARVRPKTAGPNQSENHKQPFITHDSIRINRSAFVGEGSDVRDPSEPLPRRPATAKARASGGSSSGRGDWVSMQTYAFDNLSGGKRRGAPPSGAHTGSKAGSRNSSRGSKLSRGKEANYSVASTADGQQSVRSSSSRPPFRVGARGIARPSTAVPDGPSRPLAFEDSNTTDSTTSRPRTSGAVRDRSVRAAAARQSLGTTDLGGLRGRGVSDHGAHGVSVAAAPVTDDTGAITDDDVYDFTRHRAQGQATRSPMSSSPSRVVARLADTTSKLKDDELRTRLERMELEMDVLQRERQLREDQRMEPGTKALFDSLGRGYGKEFAGVGKNDDLGLPYEYDEGKGIRSSRGTGSTFAPHVPPPGRPRGSTSSATRSGDPLAGRLKQMEDELEERERELEARAFREDPTSRHDRANQRRSEARQRALDLEVERGYRAMNDDFDRREKAINDSLREREAAMESHARENQRLRQGFGEDQALRKRTRSRSRTRTRSRSGSRGRGGVQTVQKEKEEEEEDVVLERGSRSRNPDLLSSRVAQMSAQGERLNHLIRALQQQMDSVARPEGSTEERALQARRLREHLDAILSQYQDQERGLLSLEGQFELAGSAGGVEQTKRLRRAIKVLREDHHSRSADLATCEMTIDALLQMFDEIGMEGL